MWDTERGTQTGFVPQEHGFRFVNHFAWPGAGIGRGWALARSGLRLLRLQPAALGLCGGMCLAALDLYYASRPIPDTDTPPPPDSPLYRYLLGRQFDSYAGFRVPLRVLAWMWRRDGGLDRLTIAEFMHLRQRLNDGEATPLVLLRARGASDPTTNHQVLAVGHSWEPLTRRATITLYDPNHPLAAPTLSLNLTPCGGPVDLTQSTGEALRGFFLGRFRPPKVDIPV